jgi:hypothetical protein
MSEQLINDNFEFDAGDYHKTKGIGVDNLDLSTSKSLYQANIGSSYKKKSEELILETEKKIY